LDDGSTSLVPDKDGPAIMDAKPTVASKGGRTYKALSR
jgi:hypothetical protein